MGFGTDKLRFSEEKTKNNTNKKTRKLRIIIKVKKNKQGEKEGSFKIG